MEKNKNIICQGEPTVNVVLGIFTMILLMLMGIAFITIFNKASVITGFILITIALYALSKGRKKVTFSEVITVKYFFGNEEIVQYSQCKKMYKTNDGLITAPINVIKYLKNKRERKITFVCEDEVLKEICDNYFNGFIPKDHSK